MLDDTEKQAWGPYAAFLFFLLLIVGAFFAAFSEGPLSEGHTEPEPQAQKPYEDAAPDQRGTADSPVHVVVLPTPQTQEQAAADAREKEEKRQNERVISKFTQYLFWATVALSVIAFFQLFVFSWQGIQLGKTVKHMEQGERAYIFISHESFTLAAPEAKIVLAIRNYGRTPGTTMRTRVGYLIAPKEAAPPTSPIYGSEAEGQTGEHIVLASTDGHRIDGVLPISQQDVDLVKAGSKLLWIFAQTPYLDVFGGENVTGYCRIFRREIGALVYWGGREFNYDRPPREHERQSQSAGLS